MPKIFDTFTFFGSDAELLLLECRLTELYDVVDHFIIVEATHDHQGNPKPLNFVDHIERYKQWDDKITYVIADDLDRFEDPNDQWSRERHQRNWIRRGLDEHSPAFDDIIIHSDLDEMPRAAVLEEYRDNSDWEFLLLEQDGHFWAIDWLYTGWAGTIIGKHGLITSFDDLRYGRGYDNVCGRGPAQRVLNAGWHFSWLGREASVFKKADSFAHPEVNDNVKQNAEKFYAEGYHLDGTKMEPVEVDSTYPKWMQDKSNVPADWYRPR